VLIVGVGNPDRGDDGAGRAVARRLGRRKPPDARIVETEGEATALLALMESAAAVYFIDACVSGEPAGHIHRIDVTRCDLPAASFGMSSHGFGLTEAVALAKTLQRLPPCCVVYAIEAAGFDLCAPLSQAVDRAVDVVVVALLREIERTT